MIKITHTARGNHRYRYGFRDRAGEFQIKTLFGAVAVHTREQNLTGARAVTFLAHSTASSPVAVLPPCVKTSQPLLGSALSRLRASMATTIHCDPCRAADSPIKSGLLTPAVLIEILSAPAFKRRRISETLRTPPPTVSGINTCPATASITDNMMSR